MMAPLIGVALLAAAAIPCLILAGLLHNDSRHSANAMEIARLTARLPVVRDDLAFETPRRVPGKALAAEGFVDTGWVSLADPEPELLERVAAGLRGLDSERVNDEYHARHRADDKTVIGSAAQQAGRRALIEPTFDSIVAASWNTGEREALVWRCDVCRGVVADGEKPHEACHGCGCPCRSPEVLIGRPPLAHMTAVGT